MRSLLTDDAVELLVAERGGELLGHTTFGTSRDADAPASAGELRSMFVHPTAWGRGVGEPLIVAALAGLAERGFAEATLWSFAANGRANAFYERHGFRRDGSERTEEIWGHVPEVRYRRPLP
jgi:GNAT superfamily N-acetyltransferase